MIVRLPVHVRETPEGHFIVTSVDLPELTVDEDGLDSALRALERLLATRLKKISGSMRTALSAPREPRLGRVSVSVAPRGSERAEVSVQVGLVTWTRTTSGGPVHVVRAPEVPALELAVSHPSDVELRARQALVKIMRNWNLASILASDDVGIASLTSVEVALPAPSATGSPDLEDVLLEEIGEELTQLAATGRLGRLDHRDPIVERVLAALATPGRCSVVLVGPRDVGKSALIGEIAARMASGQVPPALRGRSLWRISANELIAGARYTGMWQNRARMLLSRARADQTVFTMGDPIGIVDAGRWSESSNNLSRVLRPAMEAGELSLICECTPEALAVVAAKEPSFLDAFHRIDLHEPQPEEAARIVATAAGRFETSHGITFDANAVPAAIELTSRFEPYGALPGKAVRLLEEVVQRSVGREESPPLDREDVIAAFSERTGLPRSLLSDEISLDLAETVAFLEQRVLGQADALTAMVDLVAVIKAGLQDPTKPLGSYFFVGPTGVGKTELAKAVAELLFGDRERLVRFDMGEYQSGDAVAKLIGSGWRQDDDGELTRRVREQPFCVVLMDEIEKAHADVFDALLSVLGEGRLTDAAGRTADFRNTVVIMTSNLGAARAETQSIGFSPAGAETLDTRRQHFVDRAERFFRPEFFNRIDRIVVFSPLDQTTIRRIARREIGRLMMREGITRRQLLVEIDETVVEHCAESGFHPNYGARPLQRQIEHAISQPLARIVVTQRAQGGDLIRFRLVKGEVTAELRRPTAPEAPSARRHPAASGDATIGRAVRDVRVLVDRLSRDGEEPALIAVREEAERLLLATHQPGFWDDPDQARDVLSRYYQLNRCTSRLASITQRAQGLEDMVGRIRARGDKSRIVEVRGAIEEIENAADLLRLEVVGAAAGSEDTAALVRTNGIGPGAHAWAAELLAMYEKWGERTGRRVSRLPGESALRIDGLSSYQLLCGERGLHRRFRDHRSPLLARVAVWRLGDVDDEPDTATIVREYHDGSRRYVKDPRTGARSSSPHAVLSEGQIDAFLLEAARRLSPRRR